MKNLALAVCLFLTSCAFAPNNSPWSGVIDEHDPRTAHVVDMCTAYCANDLDAWAKHFTADAIVNINDVAYTTEEVKAAFSAGHALFEGITHEDVTCTTMRYNNGEVFTNYWYVWSGTVRSMGEQLKIKGYAWFRWEGEQIVAFYNACDPTKYNEAATGSPAEIK